MAAAGSAVGLAGCSSSSGTATGTLATRVTDQPGDIDDFESCVVTIEGIWLKPAGDGDEADASTTEGTATADESDDREYHEFDEPQEADLVQLQDGNTQLVDDREIEVGEYQFLQLDVTSVEGTLEAGGETTVDTPGNAPLQFKQAFEIREGERTTFVADFMPVKRGPNGYLLRPVASGTEVRYDEITTTEDDQTTTSA